MTLDVYITILGINDMVSKGLIIEGLGIMTSPTQNLASVGVNELLGKGVITLVSCRLWCQRFHGRVTVHSNLESNSENNGAIERGVDVCEIGG